MNFRCGLALAGFFVVSRLGGGDGSAQAGDASINLRNERISTARSVREERVSDSPVQESAGVAPGLFLIQFTQPVLPVWRTALRERGVELLRFVPQHAYVARRRERGTSSLLDLPFVTWVGRYRRDHKLHAGLPEDPAAADLPVAILLSPDATEGEAADIRGRMRTIQQESHARPGRVIRGKVAMGQWRNLTDSPVVLWVEPARPMKLNDETSARIVAGPGTNHATYTQQFGFDGRGVRVAVADSGLHRGDASMMHPDLAGRVPRLIAYGTLPNAADQHAHGTHVAGIIAGSGSLGTTDAGGNLYGLGVAPGAGLVVQRIFDAAGDPVTQPPPYEQLTGDAVDAGAEIGSNSWGVDTQGRYDVGAMEFDALVRDASTVAAGDQGFVLVFSAGNSGPASETIGSPAVAKNVIAVGASMGDRTQFPSYTAGRDAMAGFSSRGPCEDGRIKPDVVAPGTWIASLRSPLGNDQYALLPIDSDYLFMGGTSQAAPHVSGAAAVFIQYYRETYASGSPSPALVKAALIHSAADMDDRRGTGPVPNMDEGWGRVDLSEIIRSPRTHEFLDQSVLLTNGQLYERTLVIDSAIEPLKITLAYTDVPGFPAALPALVNDLDLELLAPDGKLYRGNQFDQGESLANPAGGDAVNNVEGIFLHAPVPGEYRVRVRARQVIDDARQDTTAVDQDFALVICGSIPPPETGVVLLDRTRYTAPFRIQIRVFDLDLEGQASVPVIVRSATEPAGQTVTLTNTGSAAAFAGSILTARGAATPDGRLQIANGDWIRVEYFDESEHRTNTAQAVADLLPPAILNASVTNLFGQTIVSWQTLEPATSMVLYGTSSTALGSSSYSDALVTDHQLELTNLVTGRIYYYLVISTDTAGNITTNGGGAVSSFIPQATAVVLMVDDYNFAPGDGPFIDLSAYTNSLAEIGVSWDTWTTWQQGMPSYEDLSPYPIVIWRINDSRLRPNDGIPLAQQTALERYVNDGGALLLSSMDILSRLLNQGGGSFVTNVLHVSRFILNRDSTTACTECDEDFGVPIAVGAEGDVAGNGLSMNLDYSSYPAGDPIPIGPDFADTFGPSTNATAFLVESCSGKPCGVRFPRTGEDSAGRVVFVSFPLDAIPTTTAASTTTRAAFLRRALEFLAPGVEGLGTIGFNRSRYRTNDLVTIEVADADLAVQNTVTVKVHSTSAPEELPVILRRTARHGVFRGTVPLITASNPPTTNQLRVFDGDLIHARYEDETDQGVIETTAEIDTVTPVIFAMEVHRDYSEVTITWETDEPADALIEFGESSFLGQTGYTPEYATEHSITFTGLEPDRAYFFRVVSRDVAGNTTQEDDHGKPFTFDTLFPVQPPYAEDFEAPLYPWRVMNGPTSELHWALTNLLNNGVVAAARSPLNAWATSPLGTIASRVDTTLVSPAIALTGGNVASVSFWHAFDFRKQTPFDVGETGRLSIITNVLSDPIVLAEYHDTYHSWLLETIDLTPYAGNVVYLLWQHQLLSYQAADRSGWALDDVNVAVDLVPTGGIVVSNNLAQAQVTITGPNFRTARGLVAVLTDLVPGQYTVRWGAVPFYVTPTTQSATLVSGGLIKFSGNYTFPDSNNNGMSDLWESAYFGTVSALRTRFTDTDHDGATDLAEFLAGTDPTKTTSQLKLGSLQLLQGAGQLQVTWPTITGRSYRLESSRDLLNWTAVGDWIAAGSVALTRTMAQPPDSAPVFLRVEVRP